MGNTILAPIALSEPVKAGRRRYWKQILPVTEINYEGQKIKFDPNFHMDLADAFNKSAYDQVPIVFADSNNSHNMDPRNFGGDIVKVEYRGPGKDQGTWALIEADKSAAKVIERNPKLGVSARIKQGIEKADGRFFKRAINHVLLTMNPRVQGMSPWQAVDLSEDADHDVVDLTAQPYTEGTLMGTKQKSRRRPSRQIDLSALSDDEFQNLLDLAATAGLEVEDPEDLDEDPDDDEEEEETPAPPRRKKSKVKTTKVVEREADEDDDENPDEDPDADLSDADAVIRSSERSQFQQMRFDLAERDWNQQRANYLRDGVPGFFLDLAEPVLKQPDTVTLDLAEGDDLDVRETLTKMLDGVKRVVDLSGEIGTAIDLSDDGDVDEEDALLAEWNKSYPA